MDEKKKSPPSSRNSQRTVRHPRFKWRIFPRRVHLEIETRPLLNSTDNGNEVDEVIVSGGYGINKGTSSYPSEAERRRLRRLAYTTASRSSSIVKRAVYLLNFSKRISQFPRQLDANICENCSAISKLENWGGCERERNFQRKLLGALSCKTNIVSPYAIFATSPPSSSPWDYCAWIEGGQLELRILRIYTRSLFLFLKHLSPLSFWKLRKTVSKISLGYLFFKDYYIALHCVPPCNRITLCAILPRNLPQLRNCNGTISCNNNDGGWKNIFFSFLSFRRKDPRRFSAANSVAIMLCLLSESKEMKKI